MKTFFGIIRKPMNSKMGLIEETVLTAFETETEAQECLSGFNENYCIKPVDSNMNIIQPS